ISYARSGRIGPGKPERRVAPGSGSPAASRPAAQAETGQELLKNCPKATAFVANGILLLAERRFSHKPGSRCDT
ncbi:hypothetical protein, partial [Rhodovulum sulfidophilum]|uniref:hypothetical protein n=1 Tax=Rhodovulum sulfidophilum TaxID=35806 RepID=UPI001F291F02